MTDLFDMETIPMREKTIPRPAWFVVMAFWHLGGWWTLFKPTFLTVEAAESFINKQSPGYRSFRILRIAGEMPGNGNQKKEQEGGQNEATTQKRCHADG